MTKQQTELLIIIRSIQELIINYAYLFDKNETNTRIELIEPILKQIGWNFSNMNMNREVKCKNSRKRVDYALYDKEGVCTLLIEAKSLDQPLLAIEYSNTDIQLNHYMQDERFKNAKYVLLTNGQVWQVRDKSGQNIIKSIDIIGSDNKQEENDCALLDFFEIFHADKFNLSVQVSQERLPHQTAIDRTYDFEIIQDGKEIKGKTNTERFHGFIEKNWEAVLNLQKNNRLKVTVISHIKENMRNAKQIKGTKYYSTGDYSTYSKKMLTLQIIKETGIDANIKDLKK